MFRKTCAIAGVLLLTASAWASDPWKEKSYKEWDENDVQRILADSPWAKVIKVEAPWVKGAEEHGLVPGATGQGGGGASGVSPDMAAAPGQAPVPLARFLVRWASATTVRQAIARGALLRGAMREADAEKYLAQQFTEYVVVLLGPGDLSPFAQADDKMLKEKAYLSPKKTRQKIAPSRVEVGRSKDGKTVTGVIFYFPKKNEKGEAVIAPDEKEVDFSCRAPGAVFGTKFEPQKMANKQGADI